MEMRLKIASISLAATCLAPAVHADTLSTGYGMGNMSALSSLYKARNISTTALDLRYSHPVIGKWSATGAYIANADSSYSGYGVGVNYDSEALRSTYGNLQNNGQREVSSVPQWLVRGTILGGSWRFLDTMEKANPRIGEKPQAAVEAQLYGIAFGIGLHRFFTEHVSVSFNFTNIYSASSSFGVNTTLIGLAAHYHY